MKYFVLTLLITLMSSQLHSQANERCLSSQIRQELRYNKNFRKLHAKIDSIERVNIQEKSSSIFVIPVVFHIIHRTLSDSLAVSQAISQLDILNQDFRKKNADTTKVEDGFSKADSRIEFCLARRTPNNEFTIGIEYYKTSIDNIGDRLANTSAMDSVTQVAPIWDADRYLNIWVCDMGPDLAGYAYPPGSPAYLDGVVISNLNFGIGGKNELNFNLGRTATHEVGHWLNLLHPWGPSNANPSCTNGDRVSDTPEQDTIYNGCPTAPQFSCSSKDMLSNFMGYVYDRCMGNFTQGQSNRMRNAIVASRRDLIFSNGCLPTSIEENSLSSQISLSPNPSTEKVLLRIPSQINKKLLHIKLYTLKGKNIPVQTKDVNNGYELKTAALPSGIYLLSFEGKDFQLSKKLIKL